MAFDRSWHHLCFTWENTQGEYKLYKDGQLKEQGLNHAVGSTLKSGGAVVLGQDQDSIGGGFELSHTLHGQLAEVNLWDRVLSEDDIAAQYTNCSIPHGSVLAWPVFKNLIHGNVSVVEP